MTWVTAHQERGTAGRTNRTLAIGGGESDVLGGTLIQRRCMDVRISQRVNCVMALLPRAYPQNVWVFNRHWYAPRQSGMKIFSQSIGRILKHDGVTNPRLATNEQQQNVHPTLELDEGYFTHISLVGQHKSHFLLFHHSLMYTLLFAIIHSLPSISVKRWPET